MDNGTRIILEKLAVMSIQVISPVYVKNNYSNYLLSLRTFSITMRLFIYLFIVLFYFFIFLFFLISHYMYYVILT